jgi:ATP-dependent DNA helicase RecQ
MSGRDCVGIMPTGAGKSITFQIPARILPGTVLVVSPLISLMKDQVDSLQMYGFKAVVINSTLTDGERSSRLEGLRAGKYELVYLAPEALEGSLRNFIKSCPVSMVVVDEAHCISQWGHDFRPAYRKLRGIKNDLGSIPILALTATATEAVTEDIISQLGMNDPDIYRGSFFRPNLIITFQKKGKGINTKKEVLAYLRKNQSQNGIIYCWSRKSVDSMAEYLKDHGINVLAYHAGLSDEIRRLNQEAFIKGNTQVVVATVAFGMGINKPDVRFVIHCNMPRTVESYYQEIGRAGRDGLDSRCIMFYSYSDVINYSFFLKETADPEVKASISRKTKDFFELAESSVCRHKSIVSYFGENMKDCASSCDICGHHSLEDIRKIHKANVSVPVEKNVTAPGNAGIRTDELFLALKDVRKKIAKENNIYAYYYVFNDATLIEMAEKKPTTSGEMLGVKGVGMVKLEKYGAQFLDAIKKFKNKSV